MIFGQNREGESRDACNTTELLLESIRQQLPEQGQVGMRRPLERWCGVKVWPKFQSGNRMLQRWARLPKWEVELAEESSGKKRPNRR
jgi:hypothetical protein